MLQAVDVMISGTESKIDDGCIQFATGRTSGQVTEIVLDTQFQFWLPTSRDTVQVRQSLLLAEMGLATHRMVIRVTRGTHKIATDVCDQNGCRSDVGRPGAPYRSDSWPTGRRASHDRISTNIDRMTTWVASLESHDSQLFNDAGLTL